MRNVPNSWLARAWRVGEANLRSLGDSGASVRLRWLKNECRRSWIIAGLRFAYFSSSVRNAVIEASGHQPDGHDAGLNFLPRL